MTYLSHKHHEIPNTGAFKGHEVLFLHCSAKNPAILPFSGEMITGVTIAKIKQKSNDHTSLSMGGGCYQCHFVTSVSTSASKVAMRTVTTILCH